ncbi:hypothetical protein R50073_32210 [Maricurvus nonylphenolicus]
MFTVGQVNDDVGIGIDGVAEAVLQLDGVGDAAAVFGGRRGRSQHHVHRIVVIGDGGGYRRIVEGEIFVSRCRGDGTDVVADAVGFRQQVVAVHRYDVAITAGARTDGQLFTVGQIHDDVGIGIDGVAEAVLQLDGVGDAATVFGGRRGRSQHHVHRIVVIGDGGGYRRIVEGEIFVSRCRGDGTDVVADAVGFRQQVVAVHRYDVAITAATGTDGQLFTVGQIHDDVGIGIDGVAEAVLQLDGVGDAATVFGGRRGRSQHHVHRIVVIGDGGGYRRIVEGEIFVSRCRGDGTDVVADAVGFRQQVVAVHRYDVAITAGARTDGQLFTVGQIHDDVGIGIDGVAEAVLQLDGVGDAATVFGG